MGAALAAIGPVLTSALPLLGALALVGSIIIVTSRPAATRTGGEQR